MSENVEERAKRTVGRDAVDTFVRPNMCVGLGTGSTAFYAIERVGELVRDGMALSVVATSLETEALCREHRIPLVSFGAAPIDVAIDGADEVSPDWSLIKGGGGALFREKAVALATKIFVVIVTDRKLVAALGAFPMPVEVVPFSVDYVAREIAAMGAGVTRRARGEKAYVTDNGNAILDCTFGPIEDPKALDAALVSLHGVVCTGLFVGLTSHVLVAGSGGSVTRLQRSAAGGATTIDQITLQKAREERPKWH